MGVLKLVQVDKLKDAWKSRNLKQLLYRQTT